jgi:hypothetical protein
MIVTEVLLAVQAVEAVVDLVKKIDETVDDIQDDKKPFTEDEIITQNNPEI